MMHPEQRTLIFKISKELDIDEEEVLKIYKAIGITAKNALSEIEFKQNMEIVEESLPVILIPNFGKFRPSLRRIKKYNSIIKNRTDGKDDKI